MRCFTSLDKIRVLCSIMWGERQLTKFTTLSHCFYVIHPFSFQREVSVKFSSSVHKSWPLESQMYGEKYLELFELSRIWVWWKHWCGQSHLCHCSYLRSPSPPVMLQLLKASFACRFQSGPAQAQIPTPSPAFPREKNVPYVYQQWYFQRF